VHDNSLTGADVANLRRGDFVGGQLTPDTYIVRDTNTVPSSGDTVGVASCNSGQVVTVGGFSGPGFASLAGDVAGSFPVSTSVWGPSHRARAREHIHRVCGLRAVAGSRSTEDTTTGGGGRDRLRLPFGFRSLHVLPMAFPPAPRTCSSLGLAALAPEV
jgi:hypothetical protein